MTYDQVITLLEQNRDERGIAHWDKGGVAGLKSFGIGLTKLRKLAKKVGRDHDLALRLWRSDVYDAKVMGALIDDPKKMTRQQAEAQVEEAGFWMLSHVFCTCDATLAKTSFVKDLAVHWTESADPVRRRCGYLLLYELAKDKKDKSLDDAFFEGYVDRIRTSIHAQENLVKDAMNASLLTIGQRSAGLHRRAIAAARTIGPVEVDYGDNGCQAVDVLEHLTGARIRKKFEAVKSV